MARFEDRLPFLRKLQNVISIQFSINLFEPFPEKVHVLVFFGGAGPGVAKLEHTVLEFNFLDSSITSRIFIKIEFHHLRPLHCTHFPIGVYKIEKSLVECSILCNIQVSALIGVEVSERGCPPQVE